MKLVLSFFGWLFFVGINLAQFYLVYEVALSRGFLAAVAFFVIGLPIVNLLLIFAVAIVGSVVKQLAGVDNE